MKKLLITLAILLLLVCFCFIGCNSPNETSESESKQSETSSESSTESESESETPSSWGTLPDFLPASFSSSKDLHTYMTTGSTNLEDYEEAPSVDLEGLFSPEFLKERSGYKSLSDCFCVDESLFESVFASYRVGYHTYPGVPPKLIVEYSYEFSDGDIYNIDSNWMSISINRIDNYGNWKCNTLQDCVRATETDEFEFTTYSGSLLDTVQDGYVLRKYGEDEVIYKISGGAPRCVYLKSGDYILRLSVPVHYDLENYTDILIFDEFMTDEKYKPFAAIFSEDQEVFNAAMAYIEARK